MRGRDGGTRPGATPAIGNALVVGGGIAGLSAATALGRRGIACDVLELRDAPAGAAITLQNRAIDALDELGLLDRIRAEGRARSQADIFRYFDAAGAPVPTPAVPPPAEGALPQAVVIHRAALARVLRDGAEAAGAVVRTGTTLTALTTHDGGATVRLTDGTERTYDLVIGADGVRSATRRHVFGDEVRPRYTGTTMFRWVVDGVPDVGPPGFYQSDGILNVLLRLRDGGLYLATGRDYPARPGRLSQEAARRVVAENLDAFSAPLPRALRERLGGGTRIVVNDYDGLLAPDPWYRGRALLIGDAAHATSAYLASGGGMAIEDAVVLARELAGGGSAEDALRRFMRRRYERVQLVVETSFQLGDMHRAGAPVARQNAVRARALEALKAPY
ncbi:MULTISPECIES: FAD-dependent oxidoreductase [unclassified Streptomyces]|uniref:FAD-dependent oxidoreductase n=1 Tax=unclassified Streptomyces TaxID=2593676 RepID=UPI00278C63B1|nr:MULTISPECIES: FAD-dependent oxidoreductase [unclassified Streptomyces]